MIGDRAEREARQEGEPAQDQDDADQQPHPQPAGGLAAKKYTPESAGSFPTTGALWVGLLVGIILIVGGLTFLPSLALGPIADHLAMISGKTF